MKTPAHIHPHVYSGDSTQLTYLRSRYYSGSTGRFLTRDTWGGNYQTPLTLNAWNYTSSNPINFTDPSGHFRWECWGENKRIATAEKYVPISSTDALATYTAAGIAVQCWGGDLARDKDNSGLGIAQVSNNQVATAYGEKVGNDRGYGLRCYISLNVSVNVGPSELGTCLCKTPAEMKALDPNYQQHYQLEPIHDQTDPKWAVEYMRRRIKQVIDTCNYGKINCSETDKFIIAGLAQNGPGFTIANMDQSIKTPKNGFLTTDFQILWKRYFPSQGNEGEFKYQLGLFYKFAKRLKQDRYYLPSLDDDLIKDLINGRYN